MRRFAFVAILAVAAVVSATESATDPAPAAAVAANDGVKPAIVAPGTLTGVPAAAAPNTEPAIIVKPGLPNTYKEEMDRLKKSIDEHQTSLESLQKQLDDGLKQKQRLILAQKLMTSIIALHKAERVMADLDKAVDEAKAAIKQSGEKAEEISDSIKRSESDHRKELLDLNKKLNELRAQLQEQEAKLRVLIAKRERVSTTVKRWRDHVSVLRDAHDAASHATEEKPHLRRSRDPYSVPEPPAADAILASVGLFGADKGAKSNAPGIADLIAPSPKASIDDLATRAFGQVSQSVLRSMGQARFGEDMSEEEPQAMDDGAL